MSELTVSRNQALKYGYKLVEKPRFHLRVELNQDKSGVSVTHKGRVITRVFLNRSGMNAVVASFRTLPARFPQPGVVRFSDRTYRRGDIYIAWWRYNVRRLI